MQVNMWEQLISAIIGGALDFGLSAYNNQQASWQAKQARLENYHYNEMSADAADERSRALYNDLMSPQSMVKQYQQAGLSPALMFGGGGVGGSTPQGAQGEGASGVATQTFGVDPMTAAQIALTAAQIKKTNAETKVLNDDAALKEIQREYDEMKKTTYKNEFTITNSMIIKKDGQDVSMYEYAADFDNYDAFYKAAKECAEKSDTNLYNAILSETGGKTMRAIYLARHEYSRDIATLTNEEVNATFQQQITNALKKEDFADWNAKAQIAYLQATVETENLTKAQKESWNDLLERIAKKSPTTRDIVVILGMIINAASERVSLNKKL